MANYATMGYIGFVKFNDMVLRATSCDIKTTQAISYPDLVDGKADSTVYQIGPKETGGSVGFPLVHDTPTGNCLNESGTISLSTDSVIKRLWKLSVKRDASNRLEDFIANVRYSDGLSYSYPKCMVNTFSLSVTQQAEIQITVDVFGGITPDGKGREPGKTSPSDSFNKLTYLAPARVATWNDFLLSTYLGNSNDLIPSNELREFSVSVNNNLVRVYTMSGTLAPFDIAAKKREISGTLKLLGHNPKLTQYAETNDSRFTSDAQLAFGLKIGGTANTTPYWATAANGVIFEMEEIQITTDVFETSTKWRAMGDCASDYDATYIGTNRSLGYDPGPNTYGTSSTIKPPTYTG